MLPADLSTGELDSRPAAGFVLRKRTRLRASFRGSVRWRWSPWEHVANFESFDQADAERSTLQVELWARGLRADVAVFHHRRRLPHPGLVRK